MNSYCLLLAETVVRAIRKPARLAAAMGLIVAVGATGSLAGPGWAQTLPQYANDVHLGVASCAGSTCHGAVTPWRGSTVLQNEYVTWQSKDPHAKAYTVLLNEDSRRIARNLGLPNAHEAKICLDCHANNVPANLRSKTFQISDGVSCEACHGGAVRWLGVHISGAANHAQNVAAGMYPTEDPVARAKLCMSCHVGTKDKFVTHKIMGAGHPRMPFELDTFTVTQPAHFRIDADYQQRKRVADPVQTWAVGQAVAVQMTLEGLADPNRNRQGIFPELVFFDCHACHHPMSNLRWEPRASTGLGPGVVRLADGNMIMLRIIAGQIDPALGERLLQQSRALHAATAQGMDAVATAASAMRGIVDPLVTRLAQTRFEGKAMGELLRAVIREGLGREYTDYAAAEQATMAIAAILNAMKRGGHIDEAQYKRYDAVLDKAYKAVERDEAFKPKDFIAALDALDQVVLKN